MNVDKDQATRSPGEAQLQSTQRAATAPLLVSLVAGNIGAWRIDRITPVAGENLAGAPRLNVIERERCPREPGRLPPVRDGGAVGNERGDRRSQTIGHHSGGLKRPESVENRLRPETLPVID